MSTSVLDTGSFWRDLLERVGRQAAQTALPIVAAVGASGSINAKAVTLAIAGAVVLTVLKALATVSWQPGEDWYWVLLDRAVPAAAGTALGFLPVDALNLSAVDWSAVGYAAVAAAITAVLAYYITPPTTAVRPTTAPDEQPLGPDEVL